MTEYSYYIPGYTGFCPELRDRYGKTFGRATRHIIREKPHLHDRLSYVLYNPCKQVPKKECPKKKCPKREICYQPDPCSPPICFAIDDESGGQSPCGGKSTGDKCGGQNRECDPPIPYIVTSRTCFETGGDECSGQNRECDSPCGGKSTGDKCRGQNRECERPCPPCPEKPVIFYEIGQESTGQCCPKPVKCCPEPVKCCPKPVKCCPEPVKCCPEPVKCCPEPVKCPPPCNEKLRICFESGKKLYREHVEGDQKYRGDTHGDCFEDCDKVKGKCPTPCGIGDPCCRRKFPVGMPRRETMNPKDRRHNACRDLTRNADPCPSFFFVENYAGCPPKGWTVPDCKMKIC